MHPSLSTSKYKSFTKSKSYVLGLFVLIGVLAVSLFSLYQWQVSNRQATQAAVAPTGPEFQVNDFTTGTQDFASGGKVAQSPVGYVVVWRSIDQDGGPLSGVFGMRYDANGVEQTPAVGTQRNGTGNEFQVNELPRSHELYAQVAMAPNGDYVIVWESQANGAVFGKRYNAAGEEQAPFAGTQGSATGNEFQVSTTASANKPSVAMDSSGNFVVAWYGGPGGTSEIYAKRYLANGSEVVPPIGEFGTGAGNDFQVNTTTSGDEAYPSVAMAPNGSFVIGWFEESGPAYDAHGQAYDNTGTKVGSELTLSSYGIGEMYNISTAAYNSGFVITWESSEQHSGGTGTYGKRYDATATELAPPSGEVGSGSGNEFQIIPNTENVSNASVTMDTSGNYIVVWNTSNLIHGQHYDTDGNRVGNKFTVSSSTGGGHGNPSVSMNSTEDFVVAWSGFTPNDIFARQFGPALGVTSVTPSQNAVSVSKSSDITIVFDESLDASTINQTNLPVYGSGPLLDGTYTVSTTTNTDDTVTFSPDNDFTVGSNIEFTVTTNVQSSVATGSLLAVPYVGSFNVGPIGSLVFDTPVLYPIGILEADRRSLALGDFDGDGNMDIVRGTDPLDNAEIFTNDGNGAFTASTLIASTPGLSVVTGDVNGDGDIDIVGSETTPGLRVFLNDGNGAFPSSNTYGSNNAQFFALADADGDGDLDVLGGGHSPTGLYVAFNDGSGAFTSEVTYSSIYSRDLTRVADLNNDGSIDAIVTHTDNMTVYLNSGSGTFSGTTTPNTIGTTTFGFGLGDLNADGYPDIVRSVDSQDKVSVLMNNGDGTFATKVDYPTTFTHNGGNVELADFDNDGDLDILVDGDAYEIIRNNGNGTFGTGISVGSGDGGYSGLAVADFNGDNVLDFASHHFFFGLDVVLANPPPVVTIVQPNGGETIPGGAMFDIIWTATDESGVVDTIDLEFDDGLGGGFVPIAGATGLENDYAFIRNWATAPFTNHVSHDTAGNVYIINSTSSSVSKYTIEGQFIETWGSGGAGDGLLGSPQGVFIDSSNIVYIADASNHRIQKFDSSGVFIGCIDSSVSGFKASGCLSSSGTGDGQFLWPWSITVDSSGNILVGDLNHRIQKFDSSGNFVGCMDSGASGFKANTCLTSSGTGDGQFDAPYDIALDSGGNIFVADHGNSRVQKFDSSGNFVLKWGTQGSSDGQFNATWGVAIDISDNVYVTDEHNDRVQVFNNTGGFITKFGTYCRINTGSGCVDPDGSGPQALGDGQFGGVLGIDIGSSGEVLVTDSNNDRFQVFAPGGTFSWSVPATTTTSAKIRITATDGATNQSQLESASTFTIGASGRSTIRIRRALEEELRQQAGQESVLVPDEGGVLEEPKEEVDIEIIEMDLVKVADSDAVYYVDDFGAKHAFLNRDIYSSWYPDFSKVDVIPQADIDALETGAPIFMRPGTWLVKITSDAKVYAVEQGGVLRWIPSEEAAVALYGDNWNLIIKDLPDAFFTFYSVGDPLSMAPIVYADGTVLSVVNGPNIVFIQGAGYLQLSDSDLEEGRFQTKFFLETDSLVGLNLENKGPFPEFTFEQLIVG